jgi:hypothetical protein
MTSPSAPTARRRVRRGPLIAGIALLVVFLAIWFFAPALVAGPSTTIRWQVGVGFGQPIDPTSSVVPVYMDQWPVESCVSGGDWLAPPVVTETPWSVTITMHTSSSFDRNRCVGWYDFWGTPIEVHLTAPLGGRALFDGSTIPPEARPYR